MRSLSFTFQYWNGCLDSVPVSASIVGTDSVDSAEMPINRHVLSWWIVRSPSLFGDGLLILFSVCLADIIRVPYIAHISFVDPSWFDIYGVNRSVVVLNLGIVSACLPTLPPLFLHVLHGG